MKINFKNKSGFTMIDLGVAMLTVMIFAIIMTSISYNTYMGSIEAKRTAVAISYTVDIFEHIGEIDYSDVTARYELISDISSLNKFENGRITSKDNTQIITGKIGTYDLELKIEDYNERDVIKLVTLTIRYPVSKSKTETVEMQRLKIKQST